MHKPKVRGDPTKTATCKECGQTFLHQRKDGIWDCPTCGHMFVGDPVVLPVKEMYRPKAVKK